MNKSQILKKSETLSKSIACTLVAVCVPLGCSAEKDVVHVAGAASLATVARPLEEIFRVHGYLVRLELGASSRLSRQLTHGARAAIFVSAAPEWVNALGSRVKERTVLARNHIVVVGRGERWPTFGPAQRRQLSQSRVALCQPEVPAGKVAESALAAEGFKFLPENDVAFAPNVRVALSWVEQGVRDIGLVYSSDAAHTDLDVLYRFPDHKTSYVAARLEETRAAKDAFSLFRSNAVTAVFHEAGFR